MKYVFSKITALLLFFSFVVLSFFSPVTVLAKDDTYVTGRVLVKLKANTPQDVIYEELAKQNARLVDQIDQIDVLILSVPQGSEKRVTSALSKNPHVEFAEFDHYAYATFIPNDPYFLENQWGFENLGQTINGQTGTIDADIDGPSAWDTSTGTNDLKVAILDTGIDQNHEDISSKIVLNKNYSDSPTFDDLYGHGTHVAGIVAAVTNNGLGVTGGCPSCVVMNIKVLNDKGLGAYSWIANGITFAADNNAKVINMSLGGSSPSKTLERAVNYAWKKNVIVIAAAGNSGTQAKIYPAAYANTIAVAATDNRDQKAYFSNYGSWVDVAAPGVNVFSTFPNHAYVLNKSLHYDFASGTSMATPMTTAVAALIWTTPYNTSANTVRSRLEATTDKINGTGVYWSHGRINAAQAVAP